MAKKMISALREVVGERVELEEKRGRIRSSLMNKNRMAIFKFLCEVPGSSVLSISKEFELSVSTVKWHLERLKMGRFVVETHTGNKVSYFPNGIAEKRFMEVLAILNERLPAAIYWTLLRSKGLTQDDLRRHLGLNIQPIRHSLSKLEQLNLILSVIDGRYRRYYPTDELFALSSGNRKKLRQFKTTLMKSLENDMLNPKVRVTKTGDRVIEVEVGLEKSLIRIPSDLSASVLLFNSDRDKAGDRTTKNGDGDG